MLYWSFVFAILAVICGFLGYGGVPWTPFGLAKIGFWVFLTTFLVTLVMSITGRRRLP